MKSLSLPQSIPIVASKIRKENTCHLNVGTGNIVFLTQSALFTPGLRLKYTYKS